VDAGGRRQVRKKSPTVNCERFRAKADQHKGPGEVVLGIKDAYWAVGKAATPEPESCNQVQVGGGRQIRREMEVARDVSMNT